MMKKLLKMSSLLLVMTLIVGCSTFNGQNIANTNPDAYGEMQVLTMSNKEVIGKEVLLGGMITMITAHGEKVRVEVLPYKLSQSGAPLMRTGVIDGLRLVVDIYGSVRTKGYTTGDYFTVVGSVKASEDIMISKEKTRILTIEAEEYQFWQDPRRDMYYEDYYFNSPAIRYHSPYWGFGFGPRYRHY